MYVSDGGVYVFLVWIFTGRVGCYIRVDIIEAGCARHDTEWTAAAAVRDGCN